jgi:hypothetical protein
MAALKGSTGSLEPRRHGGGAVVVESHPVNDGTVLHQAEKARLLIARLGLAGDGPYLHMAEPEFRQRLDAVPFLVEPGGQPERRRKGHSESRGLQGLRGSSELFQELPRAGAMRQPDALEPDFVGALGVHP